MLQAVFIAITGFTFAFLNGRDQHETKGSLGSIIDMQRLSRSKYVIGNCGVPNTSVIVIKLGSIAELDSY